MKKSFLLILCLLLTIALVACANNDNKENEDTTAADKTTAEVTTAGDEETSENTSEDGSEDNSSETTTGEETSSEEESTTECVHELSDEIVGIAAGHYHLTDCEHDLVLDLTAHTGTEDGICDDCEYSFADLIDEITAPEAGDKVNAGTISYKGQSEDREVSFQLGNGFFFIDENVTTNEYDFETGDFHPVTNNYKHSVHLLENGNVFYIKDASGMLTRESYDITASNLKGYTYSSDMYDYLDLELTPCGTEDLLYAFYNFAKTNCANNLTTTWGETSNITFKMGDDYSAKVYSIDFTISENGVISTLAFSYAKYFGPDYDDLGEPIPETVKYTIDDNGVVTIVDGAETDSTISIEIAQTEGERTATSTYNLDELLVKSYDVMRDGAVIGDTLNVEAGSNTTLTVSGVTPESANLELDNILATVVDENGGETWNVNAFANGNYIEITAYKAGNYVVTLTSLNVTKTFAVVVSTPVTTEIYAAIDVYGDKEPISSKNLYTGAAFEFYGIAQNSYADASFTAQITEGPEGATLTELDTADGYSFTATATGTYVITITSKVNADITNTLTINVTEAPNVGDNFKGTWEDSMFGIIVEINPTDATSGTYTITVNNSPAQYSYTLEGTTIDAFCVAGVDQGWYLQFNSNLELEIISPYGMANSLTQTSTGDEGGSGDVSGFNGTYSGVIDNMGMSANVTVVAGPESFDFTMDGVTTTYYYSMDEFGNLLVVPLGTAPGEFSFRYLADMDMLAIEMPHPMTGMNVEVGALAKGGSTTPDVGGETTISGTFTGECPDYYSTVFTITFDGDTMYVKDESMGGEATFTYTVNEYGELALTFVSGEEMVVMDLQFVYYADTEILVVNRLNYMTGMYVWVGQLEKEAATPAISGTFTGECPDYYSTVFTITFDGDTMHVKDESMGGEATFTYTVNEYGELTLTYVSGEEMVVMDLQFVYYADTEILVVNRLNQMNGMYVWVGQLEKTSGEGGEGGNTGLSIDGMWNSVDGKYQFTFWESDGDGNVNFMDENGDWLSTKGFYYTLSEDGVITFTLKTTGYGGWSGANATAVEGFITIVLDNGETVMLLPA